MIGGLNSCGAPVAQAKGEEDLGGAGHQADDAVARGVISRPHPSPAAPFLRRAARRACIHRAVPATTSKSHTTDVPCPQLPNRQLNDATVCSTTSSAVTSLVILLSWCCGRAACGRGGRSGTGRMRMRGRPGKGGMPDGPARLGMKWRGAVGAAGGTCRQVRLQRGHTAPRPGVCSRVSDAWASQAAAM